MDKKLEKLLKEKWSKCPESWSEGKWGRFIKDIDNLIQQVKEHTSIKGKIKKVIIRILNFLFFEKGTHLGDRCSGWGVYPKGHICYGCSDCEDDNG